MAIPPEAAFQCLETLVGLSIMLLTAYYLNLFISSQKYCAIFSLLSFTLLSFNLLLPRYSLFPYDLSAILFFLVCLICMKKRRWVLYFLFFAIGTYNRETTCFLAFVYLFTSMGRDSRKKLIVFCFLQLAIWVLVKAHLFYVYRENPQLGVFYLNCQTNLRMFLEPHKLILLLSNFGFVVLPTIYFHRSIESDFVKKSLLVAIPYLLGMSLVGVLAEIRIFVELFPIVISAYAMIVLKMARENGVDAERRR
jgi:hypothetical protein